MNIIRGAARLFSPRLTKCILASGLSVGVLFASGLQDLGAQQGAPPPVQSQDQVTCCRRHSDVRHADSIEGFMRCPIR